MDLVVNIYFNPGPAWSVREIKYSDREYVPVTPIRLDQGTRELAVDNDHGLLNTIRC